MTFSSVPAGDHTNCCRSVWLEKQGKGILLRTGQKPLDANGEGLRSLSVTGRVA